MRKDISLSTTHHHTTTSLEAPTDSTTAKMMSSTSHFYLPDTLRNWPYPRLVNPAYQTCNKESTEWCEAFNALPDQKKRDKFRACRFGTLYPLQSEYSI